MAVRVTARIAAFIPEASPPEVRIPIYSSFYQRAYDQVIHDIAIQNLPVIMCVDRAGVVGADRRNTSRSSRYGVF